MRANRFDLPNLAPGQAFPPVDMAWGPDSAASGLLAMGGRLDVDTLLDAYSHTIFPWYSQGQPILWWSTDPRMALDVHQFRLHRSLKQAIKRFRAAPDCEIRIDSAFGETIQACAQGARRSEDGAGGTWILPEMVAAYRALHRAGYAHSVETWQGGRMVGGLYCVAIGRAVFGESMFSRATDASKIALAALVCFCRAHQIRLIDCQQNTGHLASLGATEIARARFRQHVDKAVLEPPPCWRFDNLYWAQLVPRTVELASESSPRSNPS
jgi:leucyl/phenylalanyl-tRNA---protein transferase